VDLVVLALTFTVCTVLLLTAAAVIVAGLLGVPVDGYLGALGGAMSTIVGALLGLIAGRRTRPVPRPPTAPDRPNR
jgi:hypothetical protein